MGFMSDGLSWLHEQRHEHMTRNVYIGYEQSIAKPIKATVASSTPNSTQEVLNQQYQFFAIICRTTDVNIRRLQRGLKVWVESGKEKDYGELYELAYNGKVLYEYNDPDHNDIILYAVLKEDRCGNPFKC